MEDDQIHEITLENTDSVQLIDQAIPLIEFHGSTFVLNKTALKIISSIEEDIIVVSIVGKARSGKSYLMNLLLDLVGTDKGVQE